MENKFIKCKKEHTLFIKTNIEQIRNLKIEEDLTKKKCDSIYKLYNKIYKTIETSEHLNVNDINNMILNNSNEDLDIELFKKFIKIKNLYLIKLIIKSDLWNSYISKLNIELKLKNQDKKTDYILSKGVYRLLMESAEQFRGCWEIAEFNNNKLKRIEILEPNHLEFIKNYLKSKSII